MGKAGLTIREDAMGNIFGRLQGSDPQAGDLLFGLPYQDPFNKRNGIVCIA